MSFSAGCHLLSRSTETEQATQCRHSLAACEPVFLSGNMFLLSSRQDVLNTGGNIVIVSRTEVPMGITALLCH